MGRKDYCSSLLWVPSAKSLSKLQRVQNAAVRLVTGSSRFSHITPVMYSLNWLPVKEWFHHKIIILTLTLFKWPTAFLSLWSLTIQHPSVYSLRRNDFSSQSAERSEFIISSRAKRVRNAWTVSCRLAALIFTCIYPMVSAMTSYSSLTSRRIFVSRQHSTESDFEFPSMTKALMKSCLFIVCKTMFTIGESQAISHANGTANTRTPNCQSSQGKILYRKILRGARTSTSNSTAQATKMETASTNSGAEGTSLNEFRMLKYFKIKWKRFWIFSLNIWAKIAVPKHVLLADEFIPYRPRLFGLHSLHVNEMKCIYVGLSLSKLQSFCWKTSFKARRF